MIKSNSVVSVSVSDDKKAITFAAIGGGSVTLDTAKISQALMAHAAVHGLVQRVRDAAAIANNATVTQKFNAMKSVVEHLESGTDVWNLKRQGGTRIGADETILSQAMQEVYPTQDADKIRAKVVGMSPAERKALLMHPKIKVVADRIRGESLKEVDTDSLLADFE